MKIGHVFSLPHPAQICDFTSNFTNWPINFFAKIRLTAHDSTTLTRPSIGHFMYTYGPSTLVMWSDRMLSSLLWEHPATYTVLQLANSACLQQVCHSVYIIQNYVRSINLLNSSFFSVQCCKKRQLIDLKATMQNKNQIQNSPYIFPNEIHGARFKIFCSTALDIRNG